ncbi:GNAT family N-acetyltransferase [Rhodospirillaceae bacterium SYSU D60014]|uniref:GNAT family N-acetyltransferase n=1 Tax=Virgifigura deserti TaxID=2268457 RepID=UPI000E66E9EA
MTARPATLDHFEIALDVAIRVCTERDLTPLEWFGLFTEHRNIIRAAFEAQKQGRGLMLVADLNGYPIGQAWIDFTKESAVLWAIRVLPPLQGAGIGTRLIVAAEEVARRRGFAHTRIGVEKDNTDARRLYERLGYRLTGSLQEECRYTTPEGVPMCVLVDQWVLDKPLNKPPTGRRGRIA